VLFAIAKLPLSNDTCTKLKLKPAIRPAVATDLRSERACTRSTPDKYVQRRDVPTGNLSPKSGSMKIPNWRCYG